MTKNNNGRRCILISAMSDGVVEFQVETTRYRYRIPPVYVKRIIRMKSDFKALNLSKRVGKLLSREELSQSDEEE